MDTQYTIAELEEHRKAWIAALRSGNYKQGTQYLRRVDDTYCCLGVACEISGLVTPIRDAHICYTYGQDFYNVSLPPSVRNYYGFRSGGGEPSGNKSLKQLWELNDLNNFSFEQIANHVEANWHEYFTNKDAIDYVQE